LSLPSGAGALSRHNELGRLYRDVRARAVHPPDTDLTLELIGQSWLGVCGKV
jgi:alkylation response protein AidB-like acyl-CoA dehydrogenase